MDLAKESNEASESVFFELGKKLLTIESEIISNHPDTKQPPAKAGGLVS